MNNQKKLNSSIQILSAYTQVIHQIDLKQEQKKLLEIQKSLIYFLRQISSSVPPNKTYKQDNFLKYQYMNMIPLQQLYKKLQLSNIETGLTQQQAKERLIKNGPNKLPHRYFQWIFLILKICKCIISPFAFLLFVSIVFSLVLTNIANFIILFIIILLNGIIKYSLFQKNNFILNDPQQFISKTTIVIRNGIHRVIQNTQLVQGDIIIIQANKNIPADVRIIDNNIILVDNSLLTGQSKINYFKNSQLLQVNTFQSKNIGFYTTLCKKGRAKAIVIKTGERTLINQLLKLAETQVIKISFLRNQFLWFEKILVIIGFIGSFFFYIIGVIMKQDIDLLNAYMQGIILSIIPLGIYLNIYYLLRLKSSKLQKKANILFNNISSIQTLGQLSCICLDKTGTLTSNQLIVNNLWFSDQEFLDNIYLESVRNNQNFKQINICAVVSSAAEQKLYQQQQRNYLNITQENMMNLNQNINCKEIMQVANQYYQIVGSPLECALLKFFKTFQEISLTRKKYPVILNQNNEPLLSKFKSKNKFSLAVVQNHSNNSFYTIYIKGAPEIIWKICKFVQNNKIKQILNNQWKEKFQNNIKTNGKKGYKILGFAKKQLPLKQFPNGHFPDIHKLQTLLQQFVFLGLISFKDPVKNNVQKYIFDLKQAGVKVIMTTKEQPHTALAIAKQCNIITQKTVNQIMDQKNLNFQEAFNKSDSIVIHGDMITKFTSDDQGLPQSQKGKQIEKCLRKQQVVFARLSPFHKHIIVKQCQKLGYVVALIGKDTNDLPSIKIADIGILKGYDNIEQKRIADMILLDDDLGSILMGIKQGRTLYNNLKNIMYFILASKVPFILAFIFSVLLQIPFPATAILVLCIQFANFFTIIFMSYQSTKQNIMKKNKMNKNQHLITIKLIIQSCICIGLFQAMAGFASYFIVLHDFGFNIIELFGFSKHSIMIDSGLNNNLTNIRWDNCQVQYISPITGQTACYSTEAIKYAQTAFLFAIVFTRFICIFTIKFKKKYIFANKMINIPHLLFAIILQFFMTLIISQVIVFNELLGTRDLVWYHYMIPAIPFGLLILSYEQLKKYLIRNSNARQKGMRLNWFQQNLKW